jgi:hypothetical protein
VVSRAARESPAPSEGRRGVRLRRATSGLGGGGKGRRTLSIPRNQPTSRFEFAMVRGTSTIPSLRTTATTPGHPNVVAVPQTNQTPITR